MKYCFVKRLWAFVDSKFVNQNEHYLVMKQVTALSACHPLLKRTITFSVISFEISFKEANSIDIMTGQKIQTRVSLARILFYRREVISI